MIICNSTKSLETLKESLPKEAVIGFVPTMGALHQGHISLVKKALKRTPYVIVSIFVNPTQFNNPNDLTSYPRSFQEDCKMLEETKAYALFAPEVEEVYPTVEKPQYDLGGLDQYGEGPSRPGHFSGVVQVVSRLFDLVKPHFAVFGEKDFQQLAIIKYMVKSLGYNVEIVAAETLREEDGLAMSSRNRLLTLQQREGAPIIYRALKEASAPTVQTLFTPSQLCDRVAGAIESNLLFKTEYVQILDSETLILAESWQEHKGLRLCVAVNTDKVRLIDNIKIK